MHVILFIFFGAVVASSIVTALDILPYKNVREIQDIENGFDFQVSSNTGKQYNLNLVKADESVLHPSIKIITVGDDSKSGHLSFDSWTPSKEELLDVENVYIDQHNLAAVRLNYESGNREMQGVVDGMKLAEVNGKVTLIEPPPQNRSDYIDIGRNLTYSRQSGSVDAVVEVVLICDKEFGDVFQHDRRKILDYFTVYFWDVNLRYKTLASNNVSFRITGIIIISNYSGQPFIEEARAPDGRAEFGRILEKFSFWVYGQMGSLPKFDMAVAITNTRLEWGGGLAYLRAACAVDNNSRRHWGTLVFNDGGDWGSLTVGAHEMAHSVGAPHDDDPNYPGGCSDRGYIMSGGNDDLRWFFGPCSDRTIGEFVRSNEGACLRRIDEGSANPISPDFSSVLAPTMTEQCRRRLKNETAYVSEEDEGNCKVMKCIIQQGGGWWIIWSLPPAENTPCRGGGRCFRGRCRQPGSLIRNVGSGLCIRATNSFTHHAYLDMVTCPEPGTPLDRFVVVAGNHGSNLATPFSTPDAKENSEKCVWTGTNEGDSLWTDRCNPENGWHGWDFISVGSGEFLLSHRITKRCAKPTGGYIGSYANCDRNDPSMRWKLQ